jgi:ABC-2 type transport system ATP-binding protein
MKKSTEHKLARSAFASVAVLNNVRMYFGSYSIPLKNITFTVERGEMFGLLGPQHSGKSTTLKILAGRLRPTDGKVTVLSRSPWRRAVKARIGYVPDTSPAASAGIFDGIRNLCTAFVGPLASTNRRAALKAALAKGPDILILDEPFSDLDPKSSFELKELLLNFTRRGKTVIFSSDVFSDAYDFCDRVAILYGGDVQAVGSIRDFLESPAAIRFIPPLLPHRTLEQIAGVIRDDMKCQTSEKRQKNPIHDMQSTSQLQANYSPALPTAVSNQNTETIDQPTDKIDHNKLAKLTIPRTGSDT